MRFILIFFNFLFSFLFAFILVAIIEDISQYPVCVISLSSQFKANMQVCLNLTVAFFFVRQILTDAALLKRQKKEIEELRAKLQVHNYVVVFFKSEKRLSGNSLIEYFVFQGSLSEHLEEEILNLRNTLLQVLQFSLG